MGGRIAASLPLALGAAGGLLSLAACGGEDPVVTPASPPPPPPRVSVSFTESRLEAREGETVAIPLRYEVRDLSSPWNLRIGAAPDGASEDDYELSPETVEIPAGEEISGDLALEVTLVSDALFAEGPELLSLRFLDDPGVNATLGPPVEIAIHDSAASPCPGIAVSAPPWREDAWSTNDPTPMLATTLTVEQSEEAAGASFDLIGPYVAWDPTTRDRRPYAAFGINAWRITSRGEDVIHELDINWPGESWFQEETRLEFGFAGGRCSGEPVASCSSEGCELIP